MATGFVKLGVGTIALIVIALVLLTLVQPMIESLKAVAPSGQDAGQQEFLRLRAELRNTTIKDPYDARWWKKVGSRDYGRIENALDEFFADTEKDGVKEAELYAALKAAGIEGISNLEDAVHAAYHIVHKTKPTEVPAPDSQEDGNGK